MNYILQETKDNCAERISNLPITTKDGYQDHNRVAERAALFCRSILQYREDRPLVLRLSKQNYFQNISNIFKHIVVGHNLVP